MSAAEYTTTATIRVTKVDQMSQPWRMAPYYNSTDTTVQPGSTSKGDCGGQSTAGPSSTLFRQRIDRNRITLWFYFNNGNRFAERILQKMNASLPDSVSLLLLRTVSKLLHRWHTNRQKLTGKQRSVGCRGLPFVFCFNQSLFLFETILWHDASTGLPQ